MTIEDILTDPIRIASMAIFAPFMVKAAWNRFVMWRNGRIVRRRILAVGHGIL